MMEELIDFFSDVDITKRETKIEKSNKKESSKKEMINDEQAGSTERETGAGLWLHDRQQLWLVNQVRLVEITAQFVEVNVTPQVTKVKFDAVSDVRACTQVTF